MGGWVSFLSLFSLLRTGVGDGVEDALDVLPTQLLGAVLGLELPGGLAFVQHLVLHLFPRFLAL